MLGPSPDWIVGISALEMCRSNCSWMDKKVQISTMIRILNSICMMIGTRERGGGGSTLPLKNAIKKVLRMFWNKRICTHILWTFCKAIYIEIFLRIFPLEPKFLFFQIKIIHFRICLFQKHIFIHVKKTCIKSAGPLWRAPWALHHSFHLDNHHLGITNYPLKIPEEICNTIKPL